MKALLFNIQRFSLHDGDGIRTTFFFKGCPLNCKWCHNPESRESEPQIMFSQKKCRNCGRCAEGCLYGARETAGKLFSVNELIEVAERDAEFYKSSGGGVTLSGGEVMIQPVDFLLSFMSGLKQKGFNIAVDTCGYAPYEAFEKILPYTDTFLYDIKCVDKTRHIKFTGQDNDLILRNIKLLSNTNIEIRIPLIENVNSDDEEILRIIDFISQNIKAKKIHLLPYHALGKDKYEKLGMTAEENFAAPTAERINEITGLFVQNGLHI